MTMTVESIKRQLLALPASDRAELAHFLLHSLSDADETDEESAWDSELSRRLEEIENKVEFGEPAEVVFEELRARYAT
ncbi:MAG: addiction module protein [Pirellulaceae bacterium]|nr:addiction module protein [Pirellulaceae bacterium]